MDLSFNPSHIGKFCSSVCYIFNSNLYLNFYSVLVWSIEIHQMLKLLNLLLILFILVLQHLNEFLDIDSSIVILIDLCQKVVGKTFIDLFIKRIPFQKAY